MPSTVDEILGESQDAQKRKSLDNVLNTTPGLLDYHNSMKDQLGAHDRVIDAAINGMRGANGDRASGAPTESGPQSKLYIGQNGELYPGRPPQQFAIAPSSHGAPVFKFRIDATAPLSSSEIRSRTETKSFFDNIHARDTRFNLLKPSGPTLGQEFQGAMPQQQVRPSTFALKTPQGFDYNLGTGEYVPKTQPGYINGQQVPGTLPQPATYPNNAPQSKSPVLPGPVKYPEQ